MSIQDIINSGANITLSVTGNDLLRFAQAVVELTKQELEATIAESKSEVYYSPEQVMSLLNVSKMTLWRWDKKDNYLKPIKVGCLTRYRKSDIDKILGTK